MSDDYQLIQRVVQGELECFRTLVQRYEKVVFCFIGNLIDDVHHREDVAQDTFLAAFRHLAAFDPRRAMFSTWLLTIARNQCRNWLRKRRTATIAVVPEEAIPSGSESHHAEARQCLDALLARLPFPQRVALVLFEIQGLSYEQISTIENVKVGTVKSRINRARDKLRLLARHVPSEQT